MIKSSYGPIYLNIPRENSEAETFKANWKGVHFKNPSYYIKDNEVLISGITFVTPYGKEYSYNKTEGVTHYVPPIDIAGINIYTPDGSRPTVAPTTPTAFKPSDVDENIPYNNKPSKSTFAVIIANAVKHARTPLALELVVLRQAPHQCRHGGQRREPEARSDRLASRVAALADLHQPSGGDHS